MQHGTYQQPSQLVSYSLQLQWDYSLLQLLHSKTNKYLQLTPVLSVTYTKMAFQATPTSVVTQTTADSRTLPATAIPMILAATTPTIMATVPTTATTPTIMAP